MIDKKPQFSYRTASDEEMVQHVLSVSHQTVQAAKVYYEKKEEWGIVAKIKRARNMAKLLRLQQLIDGGSEHESECRNPNINDEED